MFDASFSVAEHLGFFIDFLTSTEMVFFIPLLFAARLLKYPAALALYAAAVVGSLVLLFIFSYADIPGIARYAHPFTSAAFICALAALLSDLRKKFDDTEKEGISPAQGGGIIFVVIVASLALFSILEDVTHLQANWGLTLDKSERRAAYAELQESIPEGASFLTMVDRPFYFDFTRNDVLGIDTPGTVSPAPGMPFYKGPEALKSYLLSLSIRYVAFRDFDNPIDCISGVYNRWVGKKTSSDRWFSMQEKYYLDVMDNIQALAVSQKRLYDSNGLTAFEIR
ncbi:MAG TPA: hypothetical protein ENI79_04455 [Rhodospirillales bacterium]|nr:hypothetical protein [Rhodospirillales bacterium]